MADTFYHSDVPKSSEQTVIIICAVFLATTWATVLLRIWVRAGLLRNFGWDDGTMLFTNCVFTCFCAFTIWASSLAASGKIVEFSLAKMLQLTKGILSAFTLYIVTMIVFKIALAIFYLRIVVRPWQRWVIYGVLAINTTYGLFYFFIVLFRCGNPADYLQNQVFGQCISNETLHGVNMTSGVINAATDWALAILPIFVLKNAGLPFKTCVAACAVLMLGTVGSIVSVVRLPYIKGLAMGPNFFVNVVNTTIWSVLEPGIGITAACLATLRPLFKCMSEGTKAARSHSASNPLPPPQQPMYLRPERSSSFSTWQTEHIKKADYEEIELQQRLASRPTFQDRLNHAKAEEDARMSFATSRTHSLAPPTTCASMYSDRTYSIKSAEAKNFSRPITRIVSHLPPPPPPPPPVLERAPERAGTLQRSASERTPGADGDSHQHERQKSKQTV